MLQAAVEEEKSTVLDVAVRFLVIYDMIFIFVPWSSEGSVSSSEAEVL